MHKVREILEDSEHLKRQLQFQRFMHDKLKKRIGYKERVGTVEPVENRIFIKEVLGQTFLERQERA